MNFCLRRAISGYVFFLIASGSYAQVSPDTSSKINNELAAFREADDLEGWLYHRIEHVDKKPTERIGFLMQTQQQAWRSYKSYTERIAWLYMLATQGYYQLQSGNILSSIAAYENALQFYESYPLPDADIVEYVLKPLGNNYTRLADYNTALFIHQKTLGEATKKGDRNAIASVYSNMAACSRWKGDLVEAEKFCRQGIDYADKKKSLFGLLLSTYADILAEQKRYDTAEVVSRQSLQQLKGFGNDMQALYWYTSALQIASRIALQRADYTPAMQYVQTALRLFDKYSPGLRQREKAKIYVMLGDISRQTGAFQNALEQYQRALILLLPEFEHVGINDIPPADKLYSENTFGDILFGKAATYEKMGSDGFAITHYLACFAAEQKLRSAFFYDESKLRELQVNRPRVQAAMQLAYKNYKTTGDRKYAEVMMQIAELSKAQILSDERNGRLIPTAGQQSSDTLYRKIRQLQEAVNYYQHEAVHSKDKEAINTLQQSAEYELAQLTRKMKTRAFETGNKFISREDLLHILKTIPADVSLLEFYEGTDSSYIIEADAGGVRSIRAIAGSNQLGAAVQQFMKDWFGNAGAMQNAPKKFYETSHTLYQSIFSNYNWQKNRRYILVPDGLFSYLPFDALLTEADYHNNFSDWPWMMKKAAYSRAWSLYTWHQQQSASYHSGIFSGFFVGSGKDMQQPKLSVEQEYKSLKALVSGQYFVNASATWQQFNDAADSAGVLHIGSHAMMTSGDSMPFLQLYDKPFYLFDLRYKKFSPALVVLGACKTADGLLMQGEGINSLSRGFTAAGAGGVVSGLWNVNDETAIAFMEIFYKKLQHHDAARALQEAKLQWLIDHRDNPALQLPYYWSGFIYSGHLQAVKLEKGGVPWWYYGLGLLMFISPAILFRFIQLRKNRKT
jgi:CHAT domain-containing protein